MQNALKVLLISSSIAASTLAIAAQQAALSDSELMATLNGAAPQDILDHATIMNKGADGAMRIVREGNNGWTCMNPNRAPMCADRAAMEWAHAWQTKGPAPHKLGFIYMLKGDGGVSNTDPYAAKETADNNWIKTGPHVMIVGAEAKSMMQAYPREAKADPNTPYVMWPGTPYEHLMLPTK